MESALAWFFIGTSIIVLVCHLIESRPRTIQIRLQSPPPRRRRVRLVTRRRTAESIYDLINRHKAAARRLGLDRAPWRCSDIRFNGPDRPVM